MGAPSAGIHPEVGNRQADELKGEMLLKEFLEPAGVNQVEAGRPRVGSIAVACTPRPTSCGSSSSAAISCLRNGGVEECDEFRSHQKGRA